MARTISSSSLVTLLISFLFISGSSAGWVLQDDYNPSNFFNMFSFWTGSDPTHGYVDYVDQATAWAQGLIKKVNGGVYMGVDSTNQAPNGRSSVRLTSYKSYNVGTLLILDLSHMPVGCGTWPAFWTVGPNWPNNGEIDIIEGVHNQAQNAMTLHTGPGCTIKNNGAFQGSITTPNCDINAAGQWSNAGCSIKAPQSNTYGAGLNAANGGVYAVAWTAANIRIFYFPRGRIPADIKSGKPNPPSWGKPLATFQGGCNIPQFFKNNQIVFDTTFCGDWAGAVWSTSGCASSQYPTCESYVENNPGAFKNAFWQINSLKVYTQVSAPQSAAAKAAASTPAPVSVKTSAYVPATTAKTTNTNGAGGQDSQTNDDNHAQTSSSARGNGNAVVVVGSGSVLVVGGAVTTTAAAVDAPAATSASAAVVTGNVVAGVSNSDDNQNSSGGSSAAASAAQGVSGGSSSSSSTSAMAAVVVGGRVVLNPGRRLGKRDGTDDEAASAVAGLTALTSVAESATQPVGNDDGAIAGPEGLDVSPDQDRDDWDGDKAGFIDMLTLDEAWGLEAARREKRHAELEPASEKQVVDDTSSTDGEHIPTATEWSAFLQREKARKFGRKHVKPVGYHHGRFRH